MENRNPFVIVDGNSLMHRAFHALPPLSNEDGVFTNAVFGFLSMLLKVVSDHHPDYLAVAFDMKGPTFRHTQYPEYKGTRKPMAPELGPQFPLIRECLTDMGVQQLTCPTFEADDILGTMARRCEEAGIPALLVTGDRDSLQLVTEQSSVLYTKRGVTEVVLYTPEKVLEDFGVTPEQIPDLKGLMGDASDNIPGIPGIGEKTAVKLLSQYGSLEAVLEHADADLKGKQREKVLSGADLGRMSKALATITRQVPLEIELEECRRTSFEGGRDILSRLGMQSILSRIDKLESAPEQAPAEAIPERVFSEEVLLDTGDALSDFVLTVQGPLALHLGRELTLALSDGRCARVPFATDLLGGGIPMDEAVLRLSPLLSGPNCLILYGAKRLMTDLARFGAQVTAPFEDDQILQYLLSPQKGKYEAPEDACALYRRFDLDLSKVQAQNMEALYRDIELPLSRTLFSMERDGFLADRNVLAQLGEKFTAQADALREEILSLCGVGPFNVNSTQQLGDVLYNKLGLPAKKKTSRGYSTDAESLQEIADKHPAIEKILLYRQVTKLNSTYIEGLLSLMDRSGRVHSWFDQTTAATGRISSSEPNLQNIPVRTDMGREIRRAFIAPEGCVLVDGDYSQIELRLLAHLSGDEAMVDAFNRGQDIHARTAAEVYGVPLEEVTHEMRSSAKAVNFGIVYGISEFGLSQNLHISRFEARDFIARYFARYPKVRRFMDECVTKGKSDGYSITLYGRRRPLPELSSPNYNMRQFGERAAMNTPVQGTAADIIKIAMNRVYARLKEEGLRARLILQVHDELILECPKEEEQAATELLRSCMEHAAELSVPLFVDIHSGHSWYETK